MNAGRCLYCFVLEVILTIVSHHHHLTNTSLPECTGMYSVLDWPLLSSLRCEYWHLLLIFYTLLHKSAAYAVVLLSFYISPSEGFYAKFQHDAYSVGAKYRWGRKYSKFLLAFCYVLETVQD